MVSTRRSVLNNTSLSSSVRTLVVILYTYGLWLFGFAYLCMHVKVAAPPEKLKVSTRRRSRTKRRVTNTLPSSSRPVKVAPPQKELEVSTISTTPSEIPKDLYDLIQNAAKAREFLNRNPDNRSAKRKLEDYELMIHIDSVFYRCDTDELPDDWRYSPNYHGSYPMNDGYAKDVWDEFRMKDTAEARDHLFYPIDEFLNMVDKDHKVVDLLGRFAVDTFNRSCQMYVNKDEANQVSVAEFMECKFFKLPETYIFYMTMEAIEQGIPGVYETKVQCDTEDGEMTLLNFKLMDREPKWNRPWVKPRELEVEYETVQDGSSDPQDFYELTGLVHRDREETKGGGFNYHNPIYSTHRIICNLSEDKKSMDFVPNVSQPPLATKTIPMDR
ncbi:hypothetical protein CTI12_AA380060 [Artemisia annua]|uniref:Uncharacterized protein n=1 Tax=Artemisia annua TaxID=35608 RepID=A0A2U1MHQ4_ARTAN|nr:hypothetical protein CTI12_AA380060 [Artemisia annua]